MAFKLRRSKQDDVIVDRVTGAFNRRQLDADVLAGVDTSGNSTATLLISINGFEAYSGKKGAAAGDQVLERVSWVIMATVRTTDIVYRHAHDSFCVLLPSTSDDDAVAVAGRIRGNVEKMPLLAESGVTVSVGVATGSGQDLAETIRRADDARSAAPVNGVGHAAPMTSSASASVPPPPPPPPPAPSPGAPFAPPSI